MKKAYIYSFPALAAYPELKSTNEIVISVVDGKGSPIFSKWCLNSTYDVAIKNAVSKCKEVFKCECSVMTKPPIIEAGL